MRYTILLALLSACGSYIDPDFRTQIASFQSEAASRGIKTSIADLTVEYGDLPTNMVNGEKGLCTKKLFAVPTVTINKTYWQELPENEKEAIIFHELGHCLLGLEHTTEPDHIMYPSGEDQLDYLLNRDKVLDSFFYDGT